MVRTARRLLGPFAAAAALLAAGCAHAPVPAQDQSREVAAARPDGRVLVTGSRIPQRVDTRNGLPATTSPVRIYYHRDLQRTDKGNDLAGALHRLDPGL